MVLKGTIWAGMQVSKSALTVEYCEFNHTDRFFHQPMNTYSNLAYFFLGVLVLQIAISDYKTQGERPKNRMQAFPLLSALLGICFIYLGFGSAFFHASLTYVGQRVDMNGTYGLTLTLVGIALYHVLYKIRFSESARRIWVISLVVLIGLFFKLSLLIPSGILLPSLILISLLLTGINYFQCRKERFGWVPIVSFLLIVIAIKIRTLDVQKFGCNPHSLVQGHAVWHLLTGLSSFCSYAFFRFTRP
ncbi:hypothetical protein GCM10028809_58560 [Spirosoma gilvum]